MSNNETGFIKILMLVLVLGLISGLTGCLAQDRSAITLKDENKILGGEPIQVSSLFSKRVIYLSLGVKWSESENRVSVEQSSFCSASAISKRVLLTAAHCVKPYTSDGVYAVLTLNPWNHPLDRKEWIKAEKIIVHEGYAGTSTDFNNDIALVKLSEDLPDYHVSKLASLAQVHSDFDLVSVGYGTTSPSPTNNVDRRSSPTLLNYVLKPVKNYSETKNIFETDQSDQKGICSGDSGSPSFIYDEEKKEFFILGVSSYVYLNSDSNSPSQCYGFAGYTNVLAYKNWISDGLKILR